MQCVLLLVSSDFLVSVLYRILALCMVGSWQFRSSSPGEISAHVDILLSVNAAAG